jgi:tetratricopeptide (TPR) repeat protein
MPLFQRSLRSDDQLDELTKRITKNPRDVTAYLDRAEYHMRRHDYESTLRDTERIIQIVALEHDLPDDLRAIILGHVHNLQSRALAAQGDRPGAAKAIELALQYRPDHADDLVQRGRLKRDVGDYSAAMSDFNHAIEMNSQSAQAHLARGMMLFEMGKRQQALADYDYALQIDPRLAAAWSNRGRLSLAQNDLNQAMRDCRKAIELDPRLISAYSTLAVALDQRGEWQGALSTLEAGLKQAPDEPSLLMDFARLNLQHNKLPEAQQSLEVILRSIPNHGEALTLRGQIHGRNRNIQAAVADLERAVKLIPYDANAHFNFALALYYAGRFSEAHAEIQRVTQLDPIDKEAVAWRAKLAQQLGLADLDEAAKVLEEFALQQTGSGRGWIVEIRQMHQFVPHSVPITYNAAVLNLFQDPPALIEVRNIPPRYTFKIMSGKQIPNTSQMGFFDAVSREIDANPAALHTLLSSLLAERVFIVSAGRLVFHAS